MRAAILEFVKEKGGGVSFVELSRSIEGFDGEFVLENPERNWVYWSALSEEAARTMVELKNSGELIFDPCPEMIYMIDGQAPQLPIVKTARSYKEPHWLPIELSLGEKA